MIVLPVVRDINVDNFINNFKPGEGRDAEYLKIDYDGIAGSIQYHNDWKVTDVSMGPKFSSDNISYFNQSTPKYQGAIVITW